MGHYMPKFRPNCHGCILSKNNPKLRIRIYNAQYRREPGDETLRDIANEIGLASPAGLYNHAKRHLAERDPKPETRAVRIAKKTEDIKAAAQKKVELSIDHDEILPEDESISALREYITQGHVKIKAGELNITPQSFLQAVRIDVDYRSKQKDRQVDIIKTMYRFASGQKKEVHERSDVTDRPSGDTDTGERFTGSLHNEDARDAVARWASGVPKKNPEPEDPHQLADVLESLG